MGLVLSFPHGAGLQHLNKFCRAGGQINWIRQAQALVQRHVNPTN